MGNDVAIVELLLAGAKADIAYAFGEPDSKLSATVDTLRRSSTIGASGELELPAVIHDASRLHFVVIPRRDEVFSVAADGGLGDFELTADVNARAVGLNGHRPTRGLLFLEAHFRATLALRDVDVSAGTVEEL